MKKEVKIFLIISAIAGIAFAVWYFFIKKKGTISKVAGSTPISSGSSSNADLAPFVEKTRAVLGTGNVANILERMEREGKSGVNAFMDIVANYAGDPQVLKDNPKFKETFEKELWPMWQDYRLKNRK